MAGTTTLSSSPPPFSTITTTADHLHNNSSSNKPYATKSSYPSLHQSFRRNPRISIFCRRGKLNNSTSEGAQEVADEGFFFDGVDLVEDGETDDEEDEETEESSVDLLVRFLQSMVRKISKRAKKASRSVLPPAISTQLVSFAVDGLMLLASLSIVKALLEVVCTLGGTVFVAILLVRVIWATVSYFQTSGKNFNQGGSSYGTAQPVT